MKMLLSLAWDLLMGALSPEGIRGLIVLGLIVGAWMVAREFRGAVAGMFLDVRTEIVKSLMATV